MSSRAQADWVNRAAIVLVGLLVTIGLSLAVRSAVSPEYESSGTVLLFPSDDAVPENANPLLYLGNVLFARNVLVEIANAESTRAGVLAGNEGADYVARADNTLNAPPTITIDVADGSPGASEELLDASLDMLSDQLEAVQDAANTPDQARIRMTVIARHPEAEPDTGPQMRALIVAIGLGVGLTAAALAAMGILKRRRAGEVHEASPGEGSARDLSSARSDRQ